MFEIIENHDQEPLVIKVIGVGGAAGNVIEAMIRKGVTGLEFVVANTDFVALSRNLTPSKLELGQTGLGAGAKPETGQQAAQASRQSIQNSLRGSDLVILLAGMGGGTGSGAAPVIAKISREMGILTVGIATMPFDFEGGKRMKVAENGVAELAKYTDSLITVPQNSILKALGEDSDVDDCFYAIDDVLTNIVCDITGIFNQPGLVNVDFDDVRTFLDGKEYAAGLATATGFDRARIAAENAVTSPLLNGLDLSRATGVLVNITAAKSHLKMKEINEAMNVVKAASADDADFIFGAIYDNQMDQALRVTIIATIDRPFKEEDPSDPTGGGVSYSLRKLKAA